MGHAAQLRNHRRSHIVGLSAAHDLHNVAGAHDGQYAVHAQCRLIDVPLRFHLNSDTHRTGFNLDNVEMSTQRVDERLFNRHRSPFRAVGSLRFLSHINCDLRKRQVGSITRAILE